MDYNVCNVNSVSFGCTKTMKRVPNAVKSAYQDFKNEFRKIDSHALDSGTTKLYLLIVGLPERLKLAVKNCFKK